MKAALGLDPDQFAALQTTLRELTVNVTPSPTAPGRNAAVG